MHVEATFDFVEAKTAKISNNKFIAKFRPFDKVECCFDIVADVDGALSSVLTAAVFGA